MTLSTGEWIALIALIQTPALIIGGAVVKFLVTITNEVTAIKVNLTNTIERVERLEK